MPTSISFDDPETDGIWRLENRSSKPSVITNEAAAGAASNNRKPREGKAKDASSVGKITIVVNATKSLLQRFKPHPRPNRSHHRRSRSQVS